MACQDFTSFPLTTEGARKQSDSEREICRERETEACSLVCQEIPLGKPLASVNNAQALSLSFTVPCCFTLNPLVSHSLYPFLLCFHSVSLFFIFPFLSVSLCHMKYCTTFSCHLWDSTTAKCCSYGVMLFHFIEKLLRQCHFSGCVKIILSGMI